MSTPQPNAPPPPSTGPTPPVIPVPTIPLGAVQTLISQLPPVAPQNAPSPHTTPVSPVEISSDVLVHESSPASPPASASEPTPAAQIAADPADPAPVSALSHGERAPTPPRGTARVTRSYPVLVPEVSLPPPRPIPLPGFHGFRRQNALYADAEMVRQHDDRVHVRSLVNTYLSSWPPDPSAGGAGTSSFDQYPEGSVGARLHPTIDDATLECAKAARTAQLTEWFLNTAIGLQVLIGALTTALGAALSGKNTSVAISILGGAATLIASYLARMRSSNEPESSRNRADALNHFLREIKGFQMDHGHELGHEWDEKINGFRLGLEKTLGSRPGSVTINPEAAGLNSGFEKGVGIANPVPGLNGVNGVGMYPSGATNPKLGFPPV
ncbi:hypothetical protein EDB87DRAFT_1687659 [Lactarius vividus]|nr:hypothetical protein EDB87DRAFT_1687659 [Lactarius vividus]